MMIPTSCYFLLLWIAAIVANSWSVRAFVTKGPFVAVSNNRISIMSSVYLHQNQHNEPRYTTIRRRTTSSNSAENNANENVMIVHDAPCQESQQPTRQSLSEPSLGKSFVSVALVLSIMATGLTADLTDANVVQAASATDPTLITTYTKSKAVVTQQKAPEPAPKKALNAAREQLDSASAKVLQSQRELTAAKGSAQSAAVNLGRADKDSATARKNYIDANEKLLTLRSDRSVKESLIVAQQQKVADLQKISKNTALALEKAKLAAKDANNKLKDAENTYANAIKNKAKATEQLSIAEKNYTQYQKQQVELEKKNKKMKEEAEQKAKKQKEEAEKKAKKQKEEEEKRAKQQKEEAEKHAKQQKEEAEKRAKQQKEEAEKRAAQLAKEKAAKEKLEKERAAQIVKERAVKLAKEKQIAKEKEAAIRKQIYELEQQNRLLEQQKVSSAKLQREKEYALQQSQKQLQVLQLQEQQLVKSSSSK